MTHQIILHAADYTVERDDIESIIADNLSGKLDSYLKKLHKDSSNPVRVELTLKREESGQATGKLVITVEGKSYRSEREKFDNLYDLVRHLFSHVKDQLAD